MLLVLNDKNFLTYSTKLMAADDAFTMLLPVQGQKNGNEAFDARGRQDSTDTPTD